MAEAGALVVSVRSLSKSFAGTRALDAVDLDLRAGEVHALLGANGSGKSTLIKILAGYHEPEPGGDVLVRGEPLAFGAPTASHRLGFRFIHQDLGLIPTLSVADNLMLGAEFPNRWWTSDRIERRWADELLARHGVDARSAAPVLSLRPSQQSLLAIVRAVESGLEAGGLLVLDEPTASLPAEEVQNLFALIERLRSRGVAVLYVTHRFPEVFRIADRVSVLRDGRLVATRAIGELDHDGLIELILGHRLEIAEYAAREAPGRALLDVEGLAGGTVADATFTAREGEVLGLTGLMGSGYESVLGLVCGAQPARAGSVAVDGVALPRLNPRVALKAGLAYTPADRRRLAAVVEWTLRENLTIPRIPSQGLLRWLSPRSEARDAKPWLDRLAVTPGHTERQFSSLSGGNQQKLVLARWLRCGAKVFLLDEPTFGVDAGAKRAIYHELRAAAAHGAAVVLSSSDTEELCEVCDRVLVLGDGCIQAELPGSSNPDEIFAETLRATNGTAAAKHSMKGAHRMRTFTVGAIAAVALALLAAGAPAATRTPVAGLAHAMAQFAKYSKLPKSLNIPPIGKKVPTGKTIAMVGILNPVPEAGIKAAAEKLGWTVTITNYSPLTPDGYASGLQSTLQQKPDGVIFWTPFPLATFQSQLDAFKSAGIPVVTQGGINYPIGGSSAVVANGAGPNQFVPLGQLYVDAGVGVLGGKAPNAAFVVDPSIPAWGPLITGVKAQMRAVGAAYTECDVPLADGFSGNAGGKVVSCLQSHPTVNELIFVTPQFAAGVPQALSAAGLSGKVKLIVGAADNPTIASIKAGTYDAAVVLETGTGTWREADALARVFAGAKVYAPQLPTSYLIVTKKNADLASDVDNFPYQPGAFLKAWGLTK